jgi:hypothetical protein
MYNESRLANKIGRVLTEHIYVKKTSWKKTFLQNQLPVLIAGGWLF